LATSVPFDLFDADGLVPAFATAQLQKYDLTGRIYTHKLSKLLSHNHLVQVPRQDSLSIQAENRSPFRGMSLRDVLFWAHLSIGVTAGLVVILMSVTGVLLAYQRQLIAWSGCLGASRCAFPRRPTRPWP
jgi:hypothetical protein